jgi:hypothetical protein
MIDDDRRALARYTVISVHAWFTGSSEHSRLPQRPHAEHRHQTPLQQWRVATNAFVMK